MASNKTNFIQDHWDWLVAGVGALALLGAVGLYVTSMGAEEEARAECTRELDALAPSSKPVEKVDMQLFNNASRTMKTPAALAEIDAKKANFLAPERRVRCVGNADDPDAKKACGAPIRPEFDECPICHVKQLTFIKVNTDNDDDGLPNDWETKFGLNPNDPNDANLDADEDGFTNAEEFAAKTNPKDAASHPDYLDSLFVSGPLKMTTLPFYFHNYTQIPSGFRFEFLDPTAKGDYGSKLGRTYRLLKGEEIGKTGFVIGEFRKQSEKRAIKGSKTGQFTMVDTSTIEVIRSSDKKAITVSLDQKDAPIDEQATLVYRRGVDKTYVVVPGQEITLNGRKYKVVKFGGTKAAPEITIEDETTSKQKVIKNS